MAVSCDPRDLEAGEEQHINHPSILVEVLSETTEEIDQGDKLREYHSLPSVQEYLLVNYATRLVEQYQRNGNLWAYRTYGPGETIVLDGVGPAGNVQLDVDRIYAKVRLPGEHG